MPSVFSLKALGLNTMPNQLDVEDGSLTVAKNVVINRDNVVESRRGFKIYGNSFGTISDRAKQLINYKERILRHFTNILQYDDGSGNFQSFAGSYTETEPGLRIKSIEANGNLYFTTSDGIMKISARTAEDFSTATGFITSAGVVKAVDASATVKYNYGDQSSFFLQDSAVAYRIVWGYRDLNNNLFLGTPSQRIEVYNPMLSLMLQDYMILLGALDNIGQEGSMIDDQNYVDTLKLSINSSASDLRTNLISLAEKIDKDILYADNYIARGNYNAATNSPVLFDKATNKGDWDATTNTPPLYDGAANLGEWDASSNTPPLFDTVTSLGIWNASTNSPVLFNTLTNLGNWNASTNTPTLSAGNGNYGDYYTVTTAGSQDFGEGSISFGIGDVVYYSGTFWRKSTTSLIQGNAGDFYDVTGTGTQNFGGGPISFNGSNYVYYDGEEWVKANSGLVPTTLGQFYQVSAGGTVNFGSGDITFAEGDYVYYDGTKFVRYEESIAHVEGDFYQVSVAGSHDFGNGSVSFNVGDYAYYTGSEWEKSTVALNNNNPGDYFVVTADGVQDFRTNIISAFITDLGMWDASSNTPTLANGIGTDGDFYEVSAPGTVDFGAGPIDFIVGNFVYYENGIWNKSTDAIRLLIGDYLFYNGTGWAKTTLNSFTNAPLEIQSVEIEGGICTITFSSGDPSLYFNTGSKFLLDGFTPEEDPNEEFTKGITVATVTNTTLTFNTTATGNVTLAAGANITSYDFRSIPEPGTIDIPATHDQLVELQDYMSFIIDQLKQESTAVIPAPAAASYITPLDITTTSTVILNITIPEGINDNYFFQIYRSAVFTAQGTAVLSTDVFPNDELQLVYEAYPTIAEREQGYVIVEDIVPDAFRGANLYTNASTGEGILQANDVPPFAKDINVFKNSVFYANTRTRHRKEISLLGVQQMIEDYNNGIIPKLTIASEGIFHTYSFILGETEQFEFETTSAATLNTSGSASYFEVNSGNNQDQYYFWYKQGTVTDPVIANKTGRMIILDGTETDIEVAEKTRDAFNVLNNAFAAVNTNEIVTVSAIEVGETIDPDFSNTPFNLTIINQGEGERVSQQKQMVETVADIAGSLAGKYFTINSTFNQDQYYFWFTVNGIGVDPAIAGYTGYKVELVLNDSANDVAQKIANVINSQLSQIFSVDVNGDELTITNLQFGPTNNADDGTSGFLISIIQTGALNVLLSNDVSPARAVTLTSNSLSRVINQNDSETIYSFYTSGAQEVPGKMIFEARNLNEGQFFITSNNDNTGNSFSPSVAPTLQINSISVGTPSTMLITTTVPHGLINLDYVVISGSDSTPSVDGYHQITYVSPTSFRIPVYVTVAGTKGGLTNVNLLESSSNEEAPNRVYYSKLQQPESVPVLNYFDVGAKDKQILRIYPLRDSLFVLKEDGLYRISGEAIPFNLGLFDSSCILVASDSVSSMDNVIYAWTRQGVSSITESGVRNVSRPIDVTLLPLASTNYPNFKTATWGIGYESDKSYTVYTVSKTSDTAASIGYKYNGLTNSWTTIQKDYVCGVMETTTDIMYVGAGDINFIEQERKTFTREDYADRQYEFEIQSSRYLNKVISLDSVNNIDPFDVFVQYQTVTIYDFNVLLKKIDLDPGINSQDYYSTLSVSPGADMRSALLSLANKLDSDNLGFTTYESSISDKSGVITSISAGNPVTITSNNHGLRTGRRILLSATNSNPTINGEYNVTVVDANTFTIDANVIDPGTNGFFTTLNNEFDDLKTCYNTIISMLNADPVVGFSNYQFNEIITKQEILITKVDRVAKRITLSAELDYVVGAFIVFKSIDCELQYSPNTFGGDPVSLKHMREAQFMFENLAFTRADMSFATDLLPKFEVVSFDADGNGRFGFSDFGSGFFGGASNAAPIRTYIPRNCQRCRYMVIKFNHRVAREKWSLFGVTITGETELSTRAYK